MRRLGCLVILVVAVALAVTAAYYGSSWGASGPLKEEARVTVPEGATLRSMAGRLEGEGVIRSGTAFLMGARLFGNAAFIKAGDYRIPAGASASKVLEILQSGKTIPLLVTIPEGMPSILVAERLRANEDLSGEIAVPDEGSVLPDSYSYERGETRDTVLARMQEAMKKFMAEQWPKRDSALVLRTPQEAVTLASIVEKETAVANERSTVAGVYLNRLKQGMPLQADPTTIYPITKGKPLGRRILQSELRAVNDYNTYAMPGLPKGPIANPGRASIEAVLHPAKTDALYFVADGKGGHVFASTYAEHQANVEKWYAIRRARGEM